MGLGVRVQKGDATGYAYVEQPRLGRDEARGRHRRPDRERRRLEDPDRRPQASSCRGATSSRRVTLDVPGIEKRELLERAAAAAPRLRHARREGRGEPRRGGPRDPRRHQRRHDGARHPAPRALRRARHRREERQAAGGLERRRRPHEPRATSKARAPSGTRARRRDRPSLMLDAQEAPAGQMEVVLAPGDSGILLHEAVGHGLEADFNRKGTSNYSGKIGEPVASDLCTVVDDATLAPEPRQHQRGRRGQRAAQHGAHREGKARRLHARPPQRGPLRAASPAATAVARASRARRCRA